MTDYSAFDIHQLDQAYPDALADIEHLTGDPARKRRLAEVGPEVYAAELTRDLAATTDNPMSLAGWAAIATVRLMDAGRAWEEDTDAAWAKVDELNAERDQLTAYNRAVKGANEDLRAALAEKDAQLTAANRRNDGLQADLDSATKANTAWANENAELKRELATKTEVAKANARNFNTLAEVVERVAKVVENYREWNGKVAPLNAISEALNGRTGVAR